MSDVTNLSTSCEWRDGAATPTVVPIDDVGDLSFDGLSEGMRDVFEIIRRGDNKGTAFGDERPGSVSFTCDWALAAPHVTSGTPTIWDTVLNISGAPALTSTNPQVGGVRQLTFRIKITDGTTTWYLDLQRVNGTLSGQESANSTTKIAFSGQYRGFAVGVVS